MYNGNESLINDGMYLVNTILDFWKWAMPDLTDTTMRGTFAEFIVKTALDSGGYKLNDSMHGWDPFDLDGPEIVSTKKKARIEVKCTGFVRPKGKQHIKDASFSIAKARILDPIKHDYVLDSPKQRNNDLYVFCVYTATEAKCNILDLSWWEFYIMPTRDIENDNSLVNRTSIPLTTVRKMCPCLAYNQICDEIVRICKSLTFEDEVRSH